MTRELARVHKAKTRARAREAGERAMDHRTGERGTTDREHVLEIEKSAQTAREKAKQAFRHR